ncbi:MAG: DUF4199 domain-containing protein [Prevotella sp.]|jgi:hypothetical protein|nr:DUF4199 domain-containing protein [Prevotella sp.]
MTAPEYVQLKAYARQDGFFLALLWTASFACYILGVTNHIMEMLALGLAITTPFFVAGRLRKFRDEGREGLISFGRSYAYTIFVFFYGAVLLAVVQFLYFAYMDNGYLLSNFSKMLSTEEGRALVTQYGMTQMVEEGLAEMASIRPIDYALNILTMNIMIGFVLGIPIGLVMQRSEVKR